jgi:hypothetical protein
VYALLSCAWAQAPIPEKPTSDGIEFFEARIRPVLAKNCYPCHSAQTKVAQGGLFLDSRNGMRTGGTSGPAVAPGDPEKSLFIHAVRYDSRKMPPSGKLPDAVIADLEKWVRMGAPDPRDGQVTIWKPSTMDIANGRRYWAFQPVQNPAIPAVQNAQWSAQAIDRFLLARMEQQHIAPVADADRAAWLRRVTFDLTGLPPAPEEIDHFQRDSRSDAYETVVDRLLSSERYGERWGRHWLDVARYAESSGRARNYPFPYAWRYRNYVIDSFNRDKSYDQFVKEQIAGDLLPAQSAAQRDEQVVATGFLALGANDNSEINPAVYRMDVVDEQINATSRAFMALTVGCARCHDHKFDPIPTTDYYRVAGIFRSTEMLSGLRRHPRDNESYFVPWLLARLGTARGEPRPDSPGDSGSVKRWESLWADLDDALKAPIADGQPAGKGDRPYMSRTRPSILTTPILAELDKFPLPPDLAMGVRDAEVGDCEVNIHGDPQQLGPKVPRGFIQVVSKPGEQVALPAKESGRRELAEWLVRRDNPLTARAAVNRIWEKLFGRGLVATVDNFGAMGEKPSHPELLDYLAARFMEQGWSIKKMIREIALSRAYRLSTADDARNREIDPDNILLWRMNRRRLEAEAIRDAVLTISGRIDFARPNASPVMTFKRGSDLGRERGSKPEDYALILRTRSVYVPVLRNYLPPMFEVFDFPEPSETKGHRDVTTVPTQALFFMNSAFVIEQSQYAAAKLLAGSWVGDAERVGRVYREVLGRGPKVDEMNRSLEFVKRPWDTEKTALEPSTAQVTVWSRLYQTLFASAEFRYRS